MGAATRAIAFALVALSLSMAVAALTSTHWVLDTNVATNSQHVFIGLQQWFASWITSAGVVSTGSQSWDSPLWTELGLNVYLDGASNWKSAGLAALALGALGIAFNGISLLVLFTSFIRPTATYLSAFPSFLSGFCFILGAVLYEILRPSFHGSIGYQWPMGLFLTSGIASDLGAYALHYGSASDKLRAAKA